MRSDLRCEDHKNAVEEQELVSSEEEEVVLRKKSRIVSKVSIPRSYELISPKKRAKTSSSKTFKPPRINQGVIDATRKASKLSTKPSVLEHIFPEDDF